MNELNKQNYTLAFWVQGVSVFVTDIHVDVYRELEVLFLIDNGLFKQYFTNETYKKALDRGLQFYSDKNAFIHYRQDLLKHIDTFKEFYNKKIHRKEKLSKDLVQTFFELTIKLCKDYTRMNFEFTDKAYMRRKSNLIIEKNLSEMSKLKDKVRSFMNTVLFESDGYTNEVFAILGKQFVLDPTFIHNLTQQEIIDLFSKKTLHTASLPERQQAFVINFDRSQFRQGKDALEIIEAFRKTTGNKKIVSGNSASLGKATGKVKVINVDYTDLNLLNVEIDKMNKGDILIAETTAPELIIACRKAAAIVTDVGGLLSHAAIVSREFGIPCIVGTEHATKVFKDGDLVEVDASSGVVKLMEKT